MKRFNNLYDSIFVMIYCIIGCSISIALVIGIVIPLLVKSQYLGASILFIVLFSLAVIAFWALSEDYFDWWQIDNDKIEYKKLFRKKIILHTADITKIVKFTEKRVGLRKIPIFYKITSYEAYAIYNQNNKAIILSTKETKTFLESFFEQFQNVLEDQTEKHTRIIG